jgi:DNA-binding NarL/FixJ family response regulator
MPVALAGPCPLQNPLMKADFKLPAGDAASPGEKPKARLLLVDDHAIVRYGISQLINRQPDLMICGEADGPKPALDQAASLNPDLALVDLSLRHASGLELIQALHSQHPDLPVLVLSMHTEPLYVELALSAGAMGYVVKEEAILTLLHAIRRILKGSIYLSESVASRLLNEKFRNPSRSLKGMEKLSPRERQVLQMLGDWKTSRQIAGELQLSIRTVECYREQIKGKLGLTSGMELVRFAVQARARRKRS